MVKLKMKRKQAEAPVEKTAEPSVESLSQKPKFGKKSKKRR